MRCTPRWPLAWREQSQSIAWLTQASQSDFDLVLMDILIPVMDALGSVRQIRALSGAQGQLPIVALRADVMIDAAEQATAAGMTPFCPNHCKKHSCWRSCRTNDAKLDARVLRQAVSIKGLTTMN